MLNISESISFQDVLLIPKHNNYNSSEVESSILINRGKIDYKFNQPIVPSNSCLITDVKMAVSLICQNSLAIFHSGSEYYRLSYSEENKTPNLLRSLKEIKDICLNLSDKKDYLKFLGFTIGTDISDYDRVNELYNEGIRIFCVEQLIGDSDDVLAMVDFIRKKDDDILIIAGNVVTGEGAKSLWLMGADIVKCGFGASYNDNSREQTGCGVPQLSALIDCASKKSRGQYLMCNDGLNSTGDIVKALCFSDFVMSYNLFTSTYESPCSNGKVPLNAVLNSIMENVITGCKMQNVSHIKELQNGVNFVKLTSSGILEGKFLK